eukprot:scaffold3513_cov102-Cylindrotheca_fusiformis.AAC.2
MASTNIKSIDHTGSVTIRSCDDEHSSVELSDVEEGMMKHLQKKTRENGEARVIIVKDISRFEGAILEDKIDHFINSFPVVMFSRTWCLFCRDAEELLVEQMGVTVHCVKVDKHPQGKEILKYIYSKTNHKTTPVIFMKGDFLGGFDEVSSLYSSRYFKGLSQADRCQAIMEKSKLNSQPYFWYPQTINGNVVRITGVVTCFISSFTAVLIHWEQLFFLRYVSIAIAFDFFLRMMGGARISPMSWIGLLISKAFDPNPRNGRPKQFATVLGTTLATLSSVFFNVNFAYSDIVGSTLMGMLAVATFMEGFLDYCVGCTVFRWGVNLGLL